MAIEPGEDTPTKGSTAAYKRPLSLALALTAAAAAALRVSFLFPINVAGNDLNLGERLGRGWLQSR